MQLNVQNGAISKQLNSIELLHYKSASTLKMIMLVEKKCKVAIIWSKFVTHGRIVLHFWAILHCVDTFVLFACLLKQNNI